MTAEHMTSVEHLDLEAYQIDTNSSLGHYDEIPICFLQFNNSESVTND